MATWSPLLPRNKHELPADVDLTQLKPFVQLRRELSDEYRWLRSVISSEGFQNCRPEVVREAFSGYEARVVVYLRHQLDYLASAYAQRVHATDYAGSIEDYYQDIYIRNCNYFSFLRGWKALFPDTFIVRRYDSKNVVADFMQHALGIHSDGFVVREAHSNPSLNSLVTQFKCEMNRRMLADKPAREQTYDVLPRLNSLFPAAKLAVPPEIAQDLRARCEESDREVARQFLGDDELFDYRSYHAMPETSLEARQFDAMYAALLDLVRAAAIEKENSRAKRPASP